MYKRLWKEMGHAIRGSGCYLVAGLAHTIILLLRNDRNHIPEGQFSLQFSLHCFTSGQATKKTVNAYFVYKITFLYCVSHKSQCRIFAQVSRKQEICTAAAFSRLPQTVPQRLQSVLMSIQTTSENMLKDFCNG